MSIMSWDPFTTLSRFDPDFDELVRRAWGGSRGSTASGFVPAVEMITEGSDVLVRLELPGIDVDKDVEVEVHDGRLTVSGHRESDITEPSEDHQILVREHRYGSFRREFALPPGVTGENLSAEYDQGILEIRIRDVAQPEPKPQKVAVKRSQGAKGHPVVEGSVGD